MAITWFKIKRSNLSSAYIIPVRTKMAKVRKELSSDTKEAIVSLHRSGLKHAEISRRLNSFWCNKSLSGEM